MKQTLTYLFYLLLLLFVASCADETEYNAVIIASQNAHDPEVSHDQLKQILENSLLFNVDVEIITKDKAKTFTCDFNDYQVIVMDYNGETWPDKTKENFEAYIKNGGGLVVCNDANGTFPEWTEYADMIGLGSWNPKPTSAHTFVTWEDDQTIRENATGLPSRSPLVTDFRIDMRNNEHPITDGLPATWLHTKDILQSGLTGPAKNVNLLATAYCDTALELGTGRHEPVMFTVDYGSGRVFHTTLGYGDAMDCAGFIVTLLRGTEWAASGTVTQQVPVDFPNSVSTNTWKKLRPLTDEELFRYIAHYKVGTSTTYLNTLKLKIRKAIGTGEDLEKYETEMLKLLQSENATLDSKKKICYELGFMGSKSRALPVLNEVSKQEGLKDAASYAIDQINNM